jgi:CBS domain-containing protein
MQLDKLRVSDLMTTSVVAMKATDLLDAARAEMQLLDVRHLPVVDDHSHVIGMLSNRDVFRALGRRKQVRVAEVMSRQVITVPSAARAHRATAVMLQYKIGALPVVGDEQQLIGIITETDLLRVAHHALGGSEPAAERATSSPRA